MTTDCIIMVKNYCTMMSENGIVIVAIVRIVRI